MRLEPIGRGTVTHSRVEHVTPVLGHPCSKDHACERQKAIQKKLFKKIIKLSSPHIVSSGCIQFCPIYGEPNRFERSKNDG
jgi:hypothetical protein